MQRQSQDDLCSSAKADLKDRGSLPIYPPIQYATHFHVSVPLVTMAIKSSSNIASERIIRDFDEFPDAPVITLAYSECRFPSKVGLCRQYVVARFRSTATTPLLDAMGRVNASRPNRLIFSPITYEPSSLSSSLATFYSCYTRCEMDILQVTPSTLATQRGSYGTERSSSD